MNLFKKKFKTGFVLSGGAVRGFAHLGAIKALKEHDVMPDVLSGVSAGSIVGAFIADGFEPGEVMELFDNKNLFGMMKPKFPNRGLFEISGMKSLLEDNLRAKTFDELKIPFYVEAANLQSGKAVYFNEGTIVDKVLASSSIPILFSPVEINSDHYVDGGVLNNMPVDPIKDKCKRLVGINVNPLEESPSTDGIRDIAIRAFHMSIAANGQASKDVYSYYIEPKDLKNFGYFDIGERQEIFDIGYKAAMDILKNN